MAISVGATASPANGTTTAVAAESGDGGGDPETPAPVTRADFDTWANAFASKHNGEQAKFRKQIEALGKTATAEPKPAAPADGAVPAAVDHEAMMGMVEQIAEIRASLPPSLKEKLKTRTDGLAYADKLRIYEAAQEAHAEAQAEAKAATDAGGETPASTGGATPKRPAARSHTSAQREATQHPKTKEEWLNIARTDRKRFEALKADDSFDPSKLSQT